jgi:hypothetical protein
LYEQLVFRKLQYSGQIALQQAMMRRPEDKVTTHQIETLAGACIFAKHHIEAGAIARGSDQAIK